MRRRNVEREGKTGRLRKVLGRECACEAWRLISLLEYKYQVMLYDAVVDYVDNGRVTEFGSLVMQCLYNRIIGIIKERRNGYDTVD